MIRALLICAAASSLVLAGCQRRETTAEAPSPVDAAQDATSAAVGTVAAPVAAATTEGFVQNLAISDMYEIQAGKVAQQKAQSSDVKSFGQMMATDHTAMSNELKPLAQAANQTLPTELDQRRKGLVDNLNAASGADFDRVYLNQQVAAHEEALSLLRGYADGGDDAQLRSMAQKAIPKVQGHLDRARQLQGSVAGAAQQ